MSAEEEPVVASTFLVDVDTAMAWDVPEQAILCAWCGCPVPGVVMGTVRIGAPPPAGMPTGPVIITVWWPVGTLSGCGHAPQHVTVVVRP